MSEPPTETSVPTVTSYTPGRFLLATVNPPSGITFVLLDSQTLEIIESRPGLGARGVFVEPGKLWTLTGEQEDMRLSVADITLNSSGVVIGDVQRFGHTVPSGHGLVRVGGKTIATASLSNDLIVLDELGNFERSFPVTCQRRQDYSHLNDLCLTGDDILLSMFTWHRPVGYGVRWRDFNCSGNIVRLLPPFPGGAVIAETCGLFQPHSVITNGMDTWVCNSKVGDVWKNGKSSFRVDGGYLRGLAVQGCNLYVGLSSRREDGHESGWAAIVCLFAETGQEVKRVVLDGIREVYALCLL